MSAAQLTEWRGPCCLTLRRRAVTAAVFESMQPPERTLTLRPRVTTAEDSLRPTRAEIDLDALVHNVEVVRAEAAGARVLAVVKADAYGHGVVPVVTRLAAAGVAAFGVALDVRLIEKGCSGAAGLYGFQKKNYRTSLRIGLPLINELRTGGYRVGVTECSTCRIQMEQGAPMATLHPVKLVALAYGLMPELQELVVR